MSEVEVATDVVFNGRYYTVTSPQGESWTFDEEDKTEAYAESALYCWSRWLDYVKEANDAPEA